MSNKELTKTRSSSTARTSGKTSAVPATDRPRSRTSKKPSATRRSDAPIVIAWIPPPADGSAGPPNASRQKSDRTESEQRDNKPTTSKRSETRHAAAAQPSTEEKLDMIEEPVHRKRLESRTQSSRQDKDSEGKGVEKKVDAKDQTTSRTTKPTEKKVETKTKPKTATTEGSSRHRGSSQSKADQNYNDRSRLASTSRPGSSLNTRKLEPPATRSPIDFRKLSSYKEKTRSDTPAPKRSLPPSVLRSLNSSKTTRSDTPAPKQHRPSSTSKTRGSSRVPSENYSTTRHRIDRPDKEPSSFEKVAKMVIDATKETSKAIEKGVRALSKKRTKSPEPKGNKVEKNSHGIPGAINGKHTIKRDDDRLQKIVAGPRIRDTDCHFIGPFWRRRHLVKPGDGLPVVKQRGSVRVYSNKNGVKNVQGWDWDGRKPMPTPWGGLATIWEESESEEDVKVKSKTTRVRG